MQKKTNREDRNRMDFLTGDTGAADRRIVRLIEEKLGIESLLV